MLAASKLNMTLLIAAKCNDGILLGAESAKLDSGTGVWSNDGVKWHQGERGGSPFALTFGGEAQIGDNISTLSLLEMACQIVGGSLEANIAKTIKESLEKEYTQGEFVNDVARQDFLKTAVVTVHLAKGSQIGRAHV